MIFHESKAHTHLVQLNGRFRLTKLPSQAPNITHDKKLQWKGDRQA